MSLILSEVTYDEIIPPELIREHLLSLPIEDIIRYRRISKEWKDIIDNLWYDLVKRDFNVLPHDKINCKEEYKYRYIHRNVTNINVKDIIAIADNKTKMFVDHDYNYTDLGITLNELVHDVKETLINLGFNKHKYDENILYFHTKRLMKNAFDNIKDSLPQNKFYLGNIEAYLLKLGKIKVSSPKFSKYMDDIEYVIKGITLTRIRLTIDRNKLYISNSTYYQCYESSYGKGSFDKDFTEFVNKEYRQKNSRKLLVKFHHILYN